MKWLLLAASLAVFCSVVAATDRPVIAVLSIPYSGHDNEYIAASYVKWIEGGGARVVPFRFNSTDDEVDALFRSVNGLLFTGGAVTHNRAAQRMFNLALEANTRGDTFPVWGTCMGFQWILQMVALNDSILEGGYLTENVSYPLNLTSAAQEATLFGAGTPMHADILAALTNKSSAATLNSHSYGVPPQRFNASERLTSFFDVLATNEDEAGKPFVSAVQAKNGVPVFAVQFHPERNQYEWGANPRYPALPYMPSTNRDPDVLKTMQYLAEFFVSHARRSNHSFSTPQEEWSSLVWQYPIVSYQTGAFSQRYFI